MSPQSSYGEALQAVRGAILDFHSNDPEVCGGEAILFISQADSAS